MTKAKTNNKISRFTSFQAGYQEGKQRALSARQNKTPREAKSGFARGYAHGKHKAHSTVSAKKAAVSHRLERAHSRSIGRAHRHLSNKVGWYGRWHQGEYHHRVHVAALVAYVLVIGGLGLRFASPVLASGSTWTQTDWSGGVGTSTTDQYDSATNVVTGAAGQLTLDASTISDWCSSPSCDNNWSKRKLVTTNNSGSSANDIPVKITVNYESSMQADFDDLRFTALNSSTLPYFIESKTDGVSATVWVKIPTLDSGVNSFYMYYGNGAASSLSNSSDVFDLYDNFSGGSLDGSKWGSSGTVDTSGGKATLIGGSSQLWSNFQSDFSTSFVYQWDVTIPDWCTSPGSLGFTMGTYYFDYFEPSYTYCSPSPNYSLRGYDRGSSSGNDSVLTNIAAGSTRTYRIVIKPDRTANYYYSTDGGANFHQITVQSGSNSPSSTYLYFITGGVNMELDNAKIYRLAGSTDQVGVLGVEQQLDGKTGNLTSAILDAGAGTVLGNLSYTMVGTGLAKVKVRSSVNSDMSGATDFGLCPVLASGTDLVGSGCVSTGQRYLQYEIDLSAAAVNDLTFQDVSITYDNDTTSPTTNASNIQMQEGGNNVANDGWTKANDVSFSWTAGADNIGGSGIGGYCLYVGSDGSADPLTTSGDWNNGGSICPYYVTGTSVNIGADSYHIQEGQNYFIVKAVDSVGNVYAGTLETFSFKVDRQLPEAPFNLSGPSTWVNSKIFNVYWTGIDVGGIFFPTDMQSGLAGVQYCITNLDLGLAGCDNYDTNWFGAAHTGAMNDVIPADGTGSGSFNTVPADASRIKDNGQSVIFARAVDLAGNFRQAYVFATVNYGTTPPSTPQNLQVSPGTNTTNDFSFSWNAPATFVGQASNINYCWTVNVAPAANTCTFAGAGITSLSAGAYATQPGLNTMYVVARDEAGNIDYNNRASVTFTANTAAPGPPHDLSVVDASIKSTSAWKLALSWGVPALSGSGVHHYEIYRSRDSLMYDKIGSTTATSFVDAGLEQIRYYYYVKACDNANNCGAASNIGDKTPTGHFTAPAPLVTGPKVSSISTRRATVAWVTERASDSRVQYGTSSGHYFGTEAAISTQTADHSVELQGLTAGTTYFAKAKWTDEDGNTGVSGEFTFTTSPAPQIREVSANDVNITSATINFTSVGAAKVKILYGKSDGFGGQKTLNTSTAQSTYSQALTGLDDGTKYFYKLNPFDSDGNEYDGNVYSFTTPARPHITNLRFQPVDGEPTSTQKVTWNTNVPATSQLSYSAEGQPTKEAVDSKSVTEHELVINGLVDNTEYSLVATSRDAAGNVATSDRQVFRTALDTRPPKISNVTVEASVKGSGNESRGQIVVSWKTDEPATSQVAFGVGNVSDLNSKTVEDARLTTDHVVIVSDLSTSQVYSIQAISKDKAANAISSQRRSAIVGRASDSILSIIFNALQQIFGLKSSDNAGGQ